MVFRRKCATSILSRELYLLAVAIMHKIESCMVPNAQNLVDSDNLDMSFTYNELPILYSMDLTSSLLPASQQMKDEDCSSYVKRDASFLEPDIRELSLSGDVAMNSTSYSRRYAKAGVLFNCWVYT